MNEQLPTGAIVTQLRLEVEELKRVYRDAVWEREALKKVYREAVWERSAILGLPQDDDWPEVFVLMPFSAELRPIYEHHIKKTVSELGLRISRADNFFGTGPIMNDIWSAIHAARIVIADCTGRSPNVFYEIGLAHAIGRHTILITQSLDDVPFDLRHLRVIEYKYTPPGMDAFERALTATIAQIGDVRPPPARSATP